MVDVLSSMLDGRSLAWLGRETGIKYRRLRYLREHGGLTLDEAKAIAEALKKPIAELAKE